ncbi:hypothetical protein MMC12_007561 [Toensbergia leucococca]|nr:hypothetical protein [Toensbergia leucococca]
MRYHDLALASFRPLLDNITPENCSALFVVSTFVAIFAFALPQPSGPNTVSAFVNQILKISVFVKGISTVVQTAKAWIAQGKLGRLLRPEVWNSLEALPQEVNEALEHLELRNKASLDSGSDKAIYSSAIQSLKRAFQVTALCSNDPGLTLLWLVAVDHSYMELLRRREQMALVILAHFGVVLHNSRDCWWSEIKPDRLVTAVYCMLNTELRPSLSWTMKSLEISEMTLFDNDDTFSVDVSPAKQ